MCLNKFNPPTMSKEVKKTEDKLWKDVGAWLKQQNSAPKTLKLCSLGLDCRAANLKHFQEFWHIPKRFIKVVKK